MLQDKKQSGILISNRKKYSNLIKGEKRTYPGFAPTLEQRKDAV